MEGPATITREPQHQITPVLSGPTHEPTVLTPGDFRKILIKRKWVILIGIFIGIAASLIYVFIAVPGYEAVARVDIDLSRSANIGIDDLLEQKLGTEGSADRLQTEVRIMQSDAVFMDVINTQDLYHRAPFSQIFKDQPYNGHLTPLQRFKLIRAVSSATRIAVVPNTEIVEVHFSSPDPVIATDVANAIVKSYMDRDLRTRFEGTSRVSDWLSKQLDQLKTQVQQSQKDLANYQRTNNLISTDAEGGNLVSDDLRTVNGQLAEAKADRIVKEARYKLAQTRNPDLLVSVAAQTILGALRQQQADLMVQQAELRAKFGPNYPKVREIQAQVSAVQRDIDNEINNLTQRFAAEYAAAVGTEALLQSRLDATKQEVYRTNESSAQFEILKHGADSASELYDALQMKLKEAGITAGLNSNNINVLDSAVQPPFPVSPQKRQDVLFGFLCGLIGGIALAIFFETLDDTLRTSDDAESVSQLPTVAVVPHFQPVNRKSGSSIELARIDQERFSRVTPDLLAYIEPQSIVAEAFRTFRSSILLSSVDREPRLILLTSSFAAEGKSTCASNLAISFAQRSARVLLVDTDLRKGTLHMKFKLSNRTGLSTLLAKESGEEDFEYPLPDLPNLAVLPRGPVAPNPGEMLASHAMEETLMRWRLQFDHVILDSSPVLAVADTLAIAPLADVTFILIRSGVTRKKALLRVREQLRRAGGRVLGTIINDVNMRLENYYTYSKHYGYGYKDNYGAGYGVNDGDK
jgi:succinoglycan biosynthesis transport protein ExoP